jgi:hypothetical protein
VKNVFRGREVAFNGKNKRIFDMEDEEEKAEYAFWLKRYGFIRDITANVRGVNEE